jgi:hypothetical protein
MLQKCGGICGYAPEVWRNMWLYSKSVDEYVVILQKCGRICGYTPKVWTNMWLYSKSVDEYVVIFQKCGRICGYTREVDLTRRELRVLAIVTSLNDMKLYTDFTEHRKWLHGKENNSHLLCFCHCRCKLHITWHYLFILKSRSFWKWGPAFAWSLYIRNRQLWDRVAHVLQFITRFSSLPCIYL